VFVEFFVRSFSKDLAGRREAVRVEGLLGAAAQWQWQG